MQFLQTVVNVKRNIYELNPTDLQIRLWPISREVHIYVEEQMKRSFKFENNRANVG
jgi:hypothetical protein